MAIAHRLSLGSVFLPAPRFRFEKWSMRLHGTKLTHFHIPTVYALVYPDGKEYWQAKHGLTDENMEQINLVAAKQARQRLSVGRARWLLKHACGHCGVGRMMLIRKHQDHSRCPRCNRTMKPRSMFSPAKM